MVDRISTSLAQQLGINNILFQQSQVNQTQLQISSGKRILTPSDDPAGAARLLDLSQSLSRLDQFQDNLDYAQNRLSLSEGTLQAVTDSIHRVRELAVQGFNATNSASDKASIAEEMFERLDEIVSLANTKDSNGDFIYAGFKAQTEPFSGSAQSGTFTFNGDQGERYIKIGENRTITDGNSGAEVFFDFVDKNGNAESMFTTLYGLATDLSNDRPAAQEALLTFGPTNPPADADQVTVNGVVYEFDSGTTNTYASGVVPVVFDGSIADAVSKLELIIEGNDSTLTINTVANGASFDFLLTAKDEGENKLTVVESSTNVSLTRPVSIPLFDHLDQLDTNLERILSVRAQIGARLNVLDSQNETNQDFKLSIASTQAQIEDLDIAEAISRFNLQIVGLQAAQQSFVKTQNLSLFNLL